MTLCLPDANCTSATTVHSLVGSQSPVPGFQAKAKITLTRSCPKALVYPKPSSAPIPAPHKAVDPMAVDPIAKAAGPK